MANLWLLIFFLAILVVAWFAAGGPSRADLSSLFLSSPLDIYSTSTESSTSSRNWFPFSYPEEGAPRGTANSANKAVAELESSPSTLRGLVGFVDVHGASASDPSKENVVLQAGFGNRGAINITGWRIVSVNTGETAVIGPAVEVAMTGSQAVPGAVILAPGAQAVIVSGRSPIGVSFRENTCSGYLSQFQQFTPEMTPLCPSAASEVLGTSHLAGDRQCVQTATQIAPCRTLLSQPQGVSASCSQFLTQRLTYNSCVSTHRNDNNFKGHTWRVFEGSDSALWSDQGDTLVLLDGSGRLVSAVSY